MDASKIRKTQKGTLPFLFRSFLLKLRPEIRKILKNEKWSRKGTEKGTEKRTPFLTTKKERGRNGCLKLDKGTRQERVPQKWGTVNALIIDLTDVLWYRPRGMGHPCWNFLTILMGSRGSLGAMKILGYSLVSGFWYLSYDPWKFLARVLRILRNWNFGGEEVIFWQSTSGSDGRTEDFRGGYVEKKISSDPVFCPFWAKIGHFC